MNIVDVAIAYVAIGAVIGTTLVIARGPRRAGDAALMVGLWPLYGPILLLGDPPASSGEAKFLAAMRGAAATPLGGILPDQAAARALAARLRDAGHRLIELDAVLARPELDEAALRTRIDTLGSATARATAELRLQTVARLRALRRRYADEIDEVGELIAQLTTQAELVRLAGTTDPAAAALVSELVARVEGLDQLLSEQSGIIAGDGAY